ncbi:uncharacterized protein C1orf21 homolog isoform X3 [Parus major]|uniref:uncharacterized protein C1orf21 homolog isoform X3 n=1 Tax=Parus major TaxID=9157 RepID=UPI0007712F64|nr:uncharacterized protein C1orf21 homolog isoform X3 [Parus major]XP_023787390.1 uncharacterized protein C1orf21 homolog isoform X4 [Cyanistes caeruleus]
MGCASTKHVSTVQNEEETQKGKNYQNGDVFGDEYRIKPVEEVKYMKNGGEDDQKIAARNQENLVSFCLGFFPSSLGKLMLLRRMDTELLVKQRSQQSWQGKKCQFKHKT